MRNNRLLNFILYSLIVLLILISLFIGFRLLSGKEHDIINGEKKEFASYTANILLNGADSVDTKKIICVNEGNGCIVHLPNATRNGGKVLGYSINKDSKIPDFLTNTDISLNKDITLYVISYRINTLYIKSDYLDFISSNEESCTVYNEQEECSVKIPTFNKIGYENKGYSTSIDSLSGFIYPNEEYKISRDTIIYPIYNTTSRARSINIYRTLVVNNSFVDNTLVDIILIERISHGSHLQSHGPGRAGRRGRSRCRDLDRYIPYRHWLSRSCP